MGRHGTQLKTNKRRLAVTVKKENTLCDSTPFPIATYTGKISTHVKHMFRTTHVNNFICLHGGASRKFASKILSGNGTSLFGLH